MSSGKKAAPPPVPKKKQGLLGVNEEPLKEASSPIASPNGEALDIASLRGNLKKTSLSKAGIEVAPQAAEPDSKLPVAKPAPPAKNKAASTPAPKPALEPKPALKPKPADLRTELKSELINFEEKIEAKINGKAKPQLPGRHASMPPPPPPASRKVAKKEAGKQDDESPPPLPRRRDAQPVADEATSDEEEEEETEARVSDSGSERDEEDAPPLPSRPGSSRNSSRPSLPGVLAGSKPVFPETINASRESFARVSRSSSLNTSHESFASAAPVKLPQPTGSPKSIKPIKPAKPAKPTKPVNTAKLAKPAKPSKPSTLSLPADSQPTAPPVTLAAPVKLAKPAPPPSRSSASPAPSPPPPPSRTSKPAPPPPRSADTTTTTWTEPELDLQLPTLWWAADDLDPASFPPCFQNSDWVSANGQLGKQKYAVFAVRLDDLATVRLKLTWSNDGTSPLNSLKETVTFVPPPKTTKQQLADGHRKYSEHVANWCEVREGTTVGDGECWTLARDALLKGCGNHAFVSSRFNHGALLATYKGHGKVTREHVTDDVRRGDILQFKSAFFQTPTGSQTFGSPDHTAIVLAVSGPEVRIIQQNYNGIKVVGTDSININGMAGGEVKVFRPVDADWISSLEDVASSAL